VEAAQFWAIPCLCFLCAGKFQTNLGKAWAAEITGKRKQRLKEPLGYINLLWGVGHKWLQTIVVVSVCKKLHCKPRQSAKRSAAVLGCGGKGSYSGSRRLSAECSRAENWDFLLTRVCGRSPVDVLLARQSVVFLPSHACAKRGRQQRTEEEQREEGNRGGKRSKRENNNDRHPTLGLFFHSYDSSTSSFN